MEENNQNNNELVNSNNNEIDNQENPNNEEKQNSERPNNPNNNNNFFNKSLNGINTANNIANSLNTSSSEAEPNETLDALNQMRNNAVNNMNNAANLATGMKNFKNNINNLKNKKNEDGNNKGDNNKKDKDNNNGNNNQSQENNNALPKKDNNNQKPQSGLGSSIDSPKQGFASKIKEKLGGKVKNKLGGSKEEGKTGTIKKLIKIFKALPFSIKMVILGLLIFIILLLLFLTIFIVLNGDEGGSDSDSFSYVDLCPGGITVIHPDTGKSEIVDFEEYIAGVVQHENVYHDQGNIEAMKANAIAARTYALNATHHCQKPIQNSTYAQTYSKKVGKWAKKAAKETASMVMLNSQGEVFSVQYDSFCYKDADCPDSTCNGTTCTATYTKIPGSKKHVIKLNQKKFGYLLVPGAGHARGMSQLVARDLQDQGKNYKEILKYFYSDSIEITTGVSVDEKGLQVDSKTGFLMRLSRPTINNAFYYNGNCGAAGTFEGECAWYGTARAKEILASIGSSKTWNDNPNGGYFCSTADAKKFKTSTDYRKPKQGAIVSWQRTQAGAYGHVAIVEKVLSDGVLISEAYNKLGTSPGLVTGGQNCAARRINCAKTGCFHTIKMSYKKLKTYYGPGAGKFQCYIYLTEAK